jgi:solute carrier family 13 (sodium-dependent dicarboxylate transporter), member 2/3/5
VPVAPTREVASSASRRTASWWPWLGAAAALLGASLLFPDGSWELDARAARALGVLLATILLWVSRAIPLSVTSLLAVGLLAATGASPGFPAAAQGFASATVVFLLAAGLIAQAVANAGLIDRVARGAARAAGSDPHRALKLVTVVNGVAALLMPSALVRARAFLPALQGLARLLD